MKKKLTVLLCIAMLVAVAGCGKTSSSQEAVAQTASIHGTLDETETTVSSNDQQPVETKTDAQGHTVIVVPSKQSTASVIATTTKKGGSNQSNTTATKKQFTTAKVDTAYEKGLAVKNIGGTYKSTFTDKAYTLKWIDDFSGTKLDTSYWTPADNAEYYNGELNYKTPNNIVVENQVMTMYGKKENYKGKQYTGASMVSQRKVEYKYGRIEMLAKLPYGKGMWPAFWTMGVTKGWPWCGEIDIMEMIGDTDGGKWNFNGDSKFMATIHWCKPDASSSTAYSTDKKATGFGTYTMPGFKNSPNVTGIEKLGDKFHVYGVEWTNTKIISYFDNIKVGEVDITDPTMSLAFHQAHYMLVNLSIGGGWPGAPDETTVFPQKYIIDWIKIWQ